MRPTKLSTILLTALVSGVVSWAGLDLATSRLGHFMAVPWTVPALLLIMAGLIVVLGWPVRQYVKGQRRHVDRLRAASVVALGKACTLAGSALTGLYSALTLVVLGQVNAGSPSGRVWPCAAAALAAAVLAAAGRLVEWFCQLPPDDPTSQAGANGSQQDRRAEPQAA